LGCTCCTCNRYCSQSATLTSFSSLIDYRDNTVHALMPGAPYTCVKAVLMGFGTW
jgi:hypothetical protein